jgi:competence protein ComFC
MKATCISCQGNISSTFSWTNLMTFSVFHKDPLLAVDQWLCRECCTSMEKLTEGCAVCSRSLGEFDKAFVRKTEDQTICYDCKRWNQWDDNWDLGTILAQNRSAIAYNEWAQELIRMYKFTGDERLKYFFASLVVDAWIRLTKQFRTYLRDTIDLISPVPLSNVRLQERGFNQSALIAKLVAEKLNIPYEENILLRNSEETKQSKKGREERLEEMFKKFLKNPEVLVDIHNKRILLIDDIYTTGATLHAAAYALKRAGAGTVISLTIAR